MLRQSREEKQVKTKSSAIESYSGRIYENEFASSQSFLVQSPDEVEPETAVRSLTNGQNNFVRAVRLFACSLKCCGG